MDIVSNQQRKKIHPHKFTMWVAIGSIVMMFAGLTSAFIVKSNQTNWVPVEIPVVFWISTAVIIISSLTVQVALRSFKQREMNQYRMFIGITLLLGVAFAIHVIGGVIALIVMFIKAFAGKTKLYSAVPIEVAAIYWHFVDALWIYLLLFFIIIGGK